MKSPLRRAFARAQEVKSDMKFYEFALRLERHPQTIKRWMEYPATISRRNTLQLFENGVITFSEYQDLKKLREKRVKSLKYGGNLPPFKKTWKKKRD